MYQHYRLRPARRISAISRPPFGPASQRAVPGGWRGAGGSPARHGLLLNGVLAAMACLAAWAPAPAHADSGITLYGSFDVGVDQIKKSQGNVQGTLFSVSGGRVIPNAVAAPSSSISRMSTSLTRQSYFGFKGNEELGDGFVAKFQLEGGFTPDAGTLSNDVRFFGRVAWVGLTTPAGEFRLGRQAVPMLVAYYFNSVERLGSTDVLAAGVTVNNLQVYQDNMFSYTVAKGPWLGQLSYTPNGGVASRVSAARSPASNVNTGQIIGGATAGSEDGTGRGKAVGAMLAYTDADLTLTGAYHRNHFGVPFGLATAAGFVPLFNVDSFMSYTLGAKYRFASTGTELAGNFYRGAFKESGDADPRITSLGLAVKQTVKLFDLIAQISDSRFNNFTHGKNRAYTLGAEYNLSKRTALYLRYAQVEDQRGDIVSSSLNPALTLAGGPTTMLLPLGALEIPVLSGAGTQMDATTRLYGVGIRHTF
ncbi:porin [Roseateles sp. YR242]|uniref:porin n=1 Tax=Roseateles sp. YR242 TaxID=1855305 RepID=UPI002100F712|nr:porin [Roseateles sp. YR242]